jgi:branched-subunit amino acid ABC-type transport system permease component
MELPILALLLQDGVTTGAVYALLALALVMVFAVTRVIWVPAGELVAFGTLTLASLQSGRPSGSIALLVGLAVLAGAMELAACARCGELARAPRRLALWVGAPAALATAGALLAGPALPFWAQVLLTLALVTALGPLLYRVAYQPIADAPVLVLLIVSVAVHFTLMGLGLVLFGAEGVRTPPFSERTFVLGGVNVSAQSLVVVGASLALMGTLAAFFGLTLYGKALRATAINRIGARLVGISPGLAGTLAFALGALLCAFSGVLVGPLTTIYYDSGFLISLKGFVGAIIGGLASYPVAAAGAVFVGVIEAFASFWASGFKEVIVFTLIIPVLLWRSLTTRHHEDEE